VFRLARLPDMRFERRYHHHYTSRNSDSTARQIITAVHVIRSLLTAPMLQVHAIILCMVASASSNTADQVYRFRMRTMRLSGTCTCPPAHIARQGDNKKRGWFRPSFPPLHTTWDVWIIVSIHICSCGLFTRTLVDSYLFIFMCRKAWTRSILLIYFRNAIEAILGSTKPWPFSCLLRGLRSLNHQ